MNTVPKGNQANKMPPSLKPRRSLPPKMDNSFDSRDNWRHRREFVPVNSVRADNYNNNSYGRKPYTNSNPKKDGRDGLSPLPQHHRDMIRYINTAWEGVLRDLESCKHHPTILMDEEKVPDVCYYKNNESMSMIITAPRM